MKNTILFIVLSVFFIACKTTQKSSRSTRPTAVRTGTDYDLKSVVKIKKSVPAVTIRTGNTKPDELLRYAETFLGVPYVYGSTDPSKGFDCSGFVWYVFKHFGIQSPRVSTDFTNCGTEVSLKDCKPGDIILFTGRDASSGKVGHLGFICENKNGKIIFLHAATSKGVSKSGFNSYYIPRFVKVNRVF
jgi:cell wall-associated NlpC family hydrolase